MITKEKKSWAAPGTVSTCDMCVLAGKNELWRRKIQPLLYFTVTITARTSMVTTVITTVSCANLYKTNFSIYYKTKL